MLLDLSLTLLTHCFVTVVPRAFPPKFLRHSECRPGGNSHVIATVVCCNWCSKDKDCWFKLQNSSMDDYESVEGFQQHLICLVRQNGLSWLPI